MLRKDHKIISSENNPFIVLNWHKYILLGLTGVKRDKALIENSPNSVMNNSLQNINTYKLCFTME